MKVKISASERPRIRRRTIGIASPRRDSNDAGAPTRAAGTAGKVAQQQPSSPSARRSTAMPFRGATGLQSAWQGRGCYCTPAPPDAFVDVLAGTLSFSVTTSTVGSGAPSTYTSSLTGSRSATSGGSGTSTV